MPEVRITGIATITEDEVDPDHDMGITEDCHLRLTQVFSGLDDLDIRPV